jgi:hypothetical protein
VGGNTVHSFMVIMPVIVLTNKDLFSAMPVSVSLGIFTQRNLMEREREKFDAERQVGDFILCKIMSSNACMNS